MTPAEAAEEAQNVDYAEEDSGTFLDHELALDRLLDRLGVSEEDLETAREENEDWTDENALDWFSDRELAAALWRCIQSSGHEVRLVTDTDDLWRYDAGTGTWDDTGERYLRQLGNHTVPSDRWGNNLARELLTQAKDDYEIAIAEDDLGIDTGLYPVANGILDLNTRELRPYEPEDYVTDKASVAYDAEAECPRWETFIQDVTRGGGDREKLQEYVGYILWHGEMRHHKTLFIPGPEEAGKSTFIETVAKLVPDTHISAATPQTLTKRFGKASLIDTWLNAASDIDADMIENMGTFKQLTGEDRVRADRKYRDPKEFHPTAKHVYSANELPDPFNADDAFWRRVLIVPFPEVVPPEDRDGRLKAIFEAELSGILNWALDGYDRLREQDGFTADRIKKETRRRWEVWGTPVVRFHARRLRYEPGAETPFDDIYQDYRHFCEANEYHAKGKQAFGKELRRYPHISKSRTTTRPKKTVYLNVRLRDQ